jgi:hypothetical protein
LSLVLPDVRRNIGVKVTDLRPLVLLIKTNINLEHYYISGIILRGGKPKYPGEKPVHRQLCTKNLARTGLSSNPSLRGERLITNSMSNGASLSHYIHPTYVHTYIYMIISLNLSVNITSLAENLSIYNYIYVYTYLLT